MPHLVLQEQLKRMHDAMLARDADLARASAEREGLEALVAESKEGVRRKEQSIEVSPVNPGADVGSGEPSQSRRRCGQG
jgi:hypothetical protein